MTNKFLAGLFGALALVAMAAPGQAADAIQTPVAAAVYHPGETEAVVQTVQYYGGFRPHYGFHRPVYRRFYHRRPFYGHGRPFFRRGPVIGAPYRRY